MPDSGILKVVETAMQEKVKSDIDIETLDFKERVES